MKSFLFAFAAAVPAVAWAGPATFLFDGSLSAEESGVPALSSVDPLGLNGFATASVFGQSRTVWGWDGNRTPIAEQAGLTFDTAGVVADAGTYSLEIVFRFTEDTGTWRSIFNSRGRMNDNAFYIDPGDHLQIYPTISGPTVFTTGDWHSVVLNRTDTEVTGFLDGVQQFTTTPTPQNLEITDPIVSFFLDNNLGGSAQTEFADGQVAKIAFRDAILTPQEVMDLENDPFVDDSGPPPVEPPPVTPPPTDGGPAVVPLPSAVYGFPVAAAVAFVARRRAARA